MTKKALVVDDNKLIRDVFTQQLIACGFESKACASLEDTIKIINDWQPDVVMLDLVMPGHDGFEVIEQIVERFQDPPKVIAVSGAISSTIQQKIQAAGFADFLQKPFRMPQISSILKKMFPEI